MLLSDDRFHEALEELEALKEVAPREASVFFLIGRIHKKLDMTDRAMVNFSTALDLKPASSGREPHQERHREASRHRRERGGGPLTRAERAGGERVIERERDGSPRLHLERKVRFVRARVGDDVFSARMYEIYRRIRTARAGSSLAR